MDRLIRIGRCLYGIAIFAVGFHMILLRDFRPEVLPPFPAWAHVHAVFPIFIGIALMISGIMIAGSNAKNICIYLGFFFLGLFISFHLPWILFLSPDKPTHLVSWFAGGETLAYSGGAFVMAGSYFGKPFTKGRILFCILMIIFGYSHFLFAEGVSQMVPKFFGFRLFWTYLCGTALIGAGIAIIFKIWIRFIALLLSAMLFIFFIFFHVPDAIQNPSDGHGNEIVRAIICLMFVGIALVIAETNDDYFTPAVPVTRSPKIFH